MPTRLSDLQISRLKPGRRELSDSLVPGLQLRVGDRARSWTLLYRFGGKQRRLGLGRWPAVKVRDARRLAKEALAKAAAGEAPATAAEEDEQAALGSFEALAAAFVEKHVRQRHKRAQESEQMIRGKLVKPWAGRPASSITRADVRDVIGLQLDAGRQRTAAKVLIMIRTLFAWAVDRGLVEANPADGIRAPARLKSRDRVLSDQELAAVWHAAGKLGWPWNAFIRLLTCTALRRDEIARLRWSEVDQERRCLVLAGERTKSGRRIEAPLNTLAVEIIEDLPQVGGPDGWLFPSRHAAAGTPISGFNKLKAKLDKLSGVNDWQLHDLRRSAASVMARLGVAAPVLAKVLNHSPGAGLSGVLGVYVRHSFDAEARSALEAWSRELQRIIGRDSPQVLRLR
jgi:integrase